VGYLYFQYDKLSWLSKKKLMFRDNNVDEITQNFYSIYGSIEGQLVSINIANRQKMGIRSLTDNKIIKCFFPEELFEQAREALGKRVYVFGLIRQYLHGEKINIQVQEMKVFPEKSASSSLSIAVFA